MMFLRLNVDGGHRVRPGIVAGTRTNAPLRFVLLLALACLLSACFETIAPDVGPRGTLRFKSNQKEALLEVDETRLGPIGMFEQSGVLLRPGEHRIVVSQKGFFKEYRLIKVVEDQLQTVEINLTPVPD